MTTTLSRQESVAAEELRELARYTTAHQYLEEIAHLWQRIGTLLAGYR